MSVSSSAGSPVGLPALAAPRFAFLDGLRALGALGVAVLHIHDYGPLSAPARSVLPGWLWTACDHGWMGVQVFFVISGFVIAHSLRHTRMNAAAGLEFVVRRFLRLSPPYWVTIAIVGLLVLVPFRFHGDTSMTDRPTGAQLAAHVFYLQNLFDLGNISTGFWMLCVEMQFYVLYAVLLGIAQRVSRDGAGGGGGVDRQAWLTLFWLPGIVLMFAYQPAGGVAELIEAADVDVEAWVLYFFGLTAFGIVTYAALEKWLPAWAFWTYAGVMLSRVVLEWMAYGESRIAVAVGLLAGVSIYVAGRTGQMSRWLNVAPLQYLGRISYSFFLIHYAVSFVVKTIGYQLTGTAGWPAVGWMVLSLVLSVPAAHALYVYVEEPAVRWSRRLGQRQTIPTPTGQAVA